MIGRNGGGGGGGGAGRRGALLDLLARRGHVTIRELAKRFRVSAMTVRRDLASLEANGRLLRTHGGASISKAGVIEFALAERNRVCAAEKRAIAAAVCALVRPGMTLTLDTGTTTLEVARALAGTPDLRVLTTSLAIASALCGEERIDLILLGGSVRKGSPDLTGWITGENLRRFTVDLAILGADGADPDGPSASDMGVARVSQAMIAGAARCCLVADHTKFERPAFVKFAPWREIDEVITDAGTPRPVRRWLEKKVKRVVYARTTAG